MGGISGWRREDIRLINAADLRLKGRCDAGLHHGRVLLVQSDVTIQTRVDQKGYDLNAE